MYFRGLLGVVTLQVIESPEPLQLTENPENDWTAALRCGRDVSIRLTLRDPIHVAKDELRSGERRPEMTEVDPKNRDVFLVHGHDHLPLHQVARVLQKLRLNPVILSEQPGRGETIIQKLERHAKAAFAVVLLTPDDHGSLVGQEATAKTRARQNVILELRYFVGKLGRNRVCVLKQGDIELPSDWLGVEYKLLDEGMGWQLALAKELKAAGFDIDLNDL